MRKFAFGENDTFNSPNRHGTSVAGIMVAKDNGNDVKGLTYDTKADSSNYGLNSVDLFAPGEDFKLCYGDNGYIIDGGTSLAAPLVTAACALIMEAKPTLSPIEIKNTILNTVDNISSLSGLCVSGGRLNILKALKGGYEDNHSFTYKTVDLRQHRMTCEICGYSALSPHVVESGSFIGQKYAVCLLCGGLCEMGFVHLGW